MYKKSLSILIFFVFFSCNKSNDDTKIISYKHHQWKTFSVTKQINGIIYNATEVPIQYYLLKNAKPNQIDSLSKVYRNERIVEVHFQDINKKDLLKPEFTQLDYDKAVEYLAFKIKNDFDLLTEDNDTIHCSGVILERNFKVAPFKRLLLFFGDVPENNKVQLLYNDKLFKNGSIKFNFSSKPIKL